MLADQVQCQAPTRRLSIALEGLGRGVRHTAEARPGADLLLEALDAAAQAREQKASDGIQNAADAMRKALDALRATAWKRQIADQALASIHDRARSMQRRSCTSYCDNNDLLDWSFSWKALCHLREVYRSSI